MQHDIHAIGAVKFVDVRAEWHLIQRGLPCFGCGQSGHEYHQGKQQSLPASEGCSHARFKRIAEQSAPEVGRSNGRNS